MPTKKIQRVKTRIWEWVSLDMPYANPPPAQVLENGPSLVNTSFSSLKILFSFMTCA
jgi:hypothetical protein